MISDLEKTVATVMASKKYRAICQDTIQRIAGRELANRGNPRAAAKATKRRLHQVYGAFEQEVDYGAVYRQLGAAYGTGSDAEIKTTCRQALGLHSSTRERLSILDEFYPAILALTGQPGSILDLGCGLNPLAMPWLDLRPEAIYIPLDIDAERVRFLNRYLVLAGFEPLARCQDVLARLPGDSVDLALLLKMSPTLERQEQGATLRLLKGLNVPFIVVSFAVKSLGGRGKGMTGQYGRQFLEMASDQPWRIEKLEFDTELVFVVSKG
jgi:16S rRNA (guanine(1405)-N(7))-methyltransferase